MDPTTRYKKHTDVQSTWREFGWKPPSEDPVIQEKWKFFQTIGVQEPCSKSESDKQLSLKR